MTDMTDQTIDPEKDQQNQSDRRSDPDRRRSVLDRRTGLDRRRQEAEVPNNRRKGPDRRRQDIGVPNDRRKNLDRRRGPGIRLDPERKAAEEGEMTDEQFEFVMAVDKYKRANSRPFPTLTEILEVIKDLGYKKLN